MINMNKESCLFVLTFIYAMDVKVLGLSETSDGLFELVSAQFEEFSKLNKEFTEKNIVAFLTQNFNYINAQLNLLEP